MQSAKKQARQQSSILPDESVAAAERLSERKSRSNAAKRRFEDLSSTIARSRTGTSRKRSRNTVPKTRVGRRLTTLQRDVALFANLFRLRVTDTVDIGQRDRNPLLRWNVDTCNTRHAPNSFMVTVRSKRPNLARLTERRDYMNFRHRVNSLARRNDCPDLF